MGLPRGGLTHWSPDGHSGSHPRLRNWPPCASPDTTPQESASSPTFSTTLSPPAPNSTSKTHGTSPSVSTACSPGHTIVNTHLRVPNSLLTAPPTSPLGLGPTVGYAPNPLSSRGHGNLAVCSESTVPRLPWRKAGHVTLYLPVKREWK